MNRLEELREKLESLAELSLEDLQGLDSEIVSVFNTIAAGEFEGVESDDVELLDELKLATQSVRERADELQVEADAKQAKIDEMKSVVNAGTEVAEAATGDEDGADDAKDADDDEDADDEDEDAEASTTEVATDESSEPEAKVEEAPEAEKKVLPALAAAAKRRKSAHMAQQSIVKVKEKASDVLFNSADGRKITFSQLADEMVNKRRQFGRIRDGVSDRMSLASQVFDFPEERKLTADDSPTAIKEKIDAVIADAMRPDTWDEALTASGGFCAPLGTRYEIETISDAFRPVRDALPSFNADRGGIRFRAGLSLATATAIDSTEVWTNATDTTPGENTKNVGRIECTDITEVTVNAITRILEFGNFMARTDNETIQAYIRVTDADWARTAETQLLDGIAAASVNVSTDQHLGLARDFLEQVGRAAAQYRSRHRMRPDARLRVLVPQWVPDAVAADLTRGQQSDPGFLETTTQKFVSLLASRNVNVTFYADTATSAGQVYGAQQNQAGIGVAQDLLAWSSTVVWYLFHEGAFLHLDNGTLDLGLVRDSTLNGTNDAQLFAESFENVAFIGVESLKVTSNLCVSGMSAGTDDLTTQCVS